MDNARGSLFCERAERKRCEGVDGGGARVSEREVSLEVAQLKNMVAVVRPWL